MMGRQQAGQAPLFYAFNLEDHVPANHLLRGIDQFLDLSELHQHLAGQKMGSEWPLFAFRTARRQPACSERG